MRDCIGNKILEGKLLRWDIPAELAKRLICTVIYTNDGGIHTPDGPTPPVISLRFDLPIELTRPGEPIVDQFTVIENPNATVNEDNDDNQHKPRIVQ